MKWELIRLCDGKVSVRFGGTELAVVSGDLGSIERMLNRVAQVDENRRVIPRDPRQMELNAA